jgi:hypothetical protein
MGTNVANFKDGSYGAWDSSSNVSPSTLKVRLTIFFQVELITNVVTQLRSISIGG